MATMTKVTYMTTVSSKYIFSNHPLFFIIILIKIVKFKILSKQTKRYFTKVLTRQPSYLNYLSYGTLTIILALKIAREYGIYKLLSLGLWD